MATETKKSNSIITTSIPVPTDTFSVELNLPRVLRYTVLNVGELDFDLSKVSHENLAYSVIHGMGQRIPDAAAIGTTDKDGNIVPKAKRSEMKFHKMNEVIVHYESGTKDWNRKGEGGGGGIPLTIQAIMRVKGFTQEQAEASVEVHAGIHFKGDRKKALAHLATGKRVREAMDAIRAERNARVAGSDAPDADEMLDELTTEAEGEEAETETETTE